ncbi:hypothetical protein AnigIFM63309_007567 [Aspergillus niger]|nr:hypothetical protein AnigIFM63309_007567 [Aspergillus niger]
MSEHTTRKYGDLESRGAEATGRQAISTGLFNSRTGAAGGDVDGGDGGKISIAKEHNFVETANINVSGGNAHQTGYHARGFHHVQTSGNVKGGNGGTLEL